MPNEVTPEQLAEWEEEGRSLAYWRTRAEAAEHERDRLAAENAKLLPVVRRHVERCGAYWGLCPDCNQRYESDGHAPDCPPAAALAGEETT